MLILGQLQRDGRKKMNKLLFVDDELDILNGYSSLFVKKERKEFETLLDNFLGKNESISIKDQFEDYDVVTANQGQTAVDIVKQSLKVKSPIKVAFIDMRMPPGISGMETAKLIRRLDPKIEIVIVTAYSDNDFRTVLHEVGSPDKILFLKKPFDQQEIKQLALNLVNKYNNETIKDDFIANVSHELKTPLASILGFSQLLSEKDLDEENREFNTHILHSANLMKQLIDELLASVTFKKEGIVLNIEKLKLEDYLKFSYQNLLPLFKDKVDLDFKLDISKISESDFVFADRFKIFQVLSNLVNNAYKFTAAGQVVLSADKEGDVLIIRVSDTGPGISPDNYNFIFEKFSRIENRHHNIPGLGLGLSLVKNILDAHQAEIKVGHNHPNGAVFSIYLKPRN